MGGSTLGLAMRERKAIDVLCIFLYRYWNSRCAANDLCHIRTHTYNNNQTKSSYQVLDLARSIHYMYLGKSTHRLLPVDSYPWIATHGLLLVPGGIATLAIFAGSAFAGPASLQQTWSVPRPSFTMRRHIEMGIIEPSPARPAHHVFVILVMT